MPSFISVFYYSKSLFPILHFEQSVCRFSKTVSPPFAHALMWSTWRIILGSVAGDRPQFLHLKLSRLITINRNLQFIIRDVLCFVLDSISKLLMASPDDKFSSLLM